MKKTKKKNKAAAVMHYTCGLCGKTKTYLFAFCACNECEDMLRKHIKYYRKKRKKIEQR